MQWYSPLEDRIHIYGRTVRQQPLPLFWTGSGVEIDTDGGEVWFEVESAHAFWEEWIRIELDGVCIQRFLLEAGRKRICAYRGLPAGIRRTVRLLKEVQPYAEDPDRYLAVHAIGTDGKLYMAKPKKCRLEFIGDSLTSGEGLSGPEGLTAWAPATFGLQGHYACLLANWLEADFRILSQSGWGVYCAWDNNVRQNMPAYYDRVCGIVEGEKNIAMGAQRENDFSAWQPDVIVVNLGTNDGSAAAQPAWVDPVTGRAWKLERGQDGRLLASSKKKVQDAAVAFLRTLRARNSHAYLLWAYGMVGSEIRPELEEAVETYRKEDPRAKFVPLEGMRDEWVGANCHPNAASHRAAAKVLLEEIRQFL